MTTKYILIYNLRNMFNMFPSNIIILVVATEAAGFELEGVKSLAQGDTPATGSWVRTPNP